MKRGDKALVYYDVLTRTDLEGCAVLIRQNQALEKGYESWVVLFDGEGEHFVTRLVHESCLVGKEAAP